MSKIRSTSSIEKKRLHTNYVQRTREVKRADIVERVSPITRIENDVSSPSVNHLMYSDTLYDSLMELKREYLNYYHHERNLQDAIEVIQNDLDIPLEHIVNLIEKYNAAIVSLEDFDFTLRTSHSGRIKDLVSTYDEDLNKLGISINEKSRLELNEKKFKDYLLWADSNMDTAFTSMKQLILKLYKEFKNIRGPYKDEFDHRYDDILPDDYQGNIFDKKS